MKLIEPTYEIINQNSGTLDDIYKHIELCGRTCYKSEDRITEDSAEKFVEAMIKNNHTAMLEHGTVYLYIKHNEQHGVDTGDPFDISFDLLFCKYAKHNSNFDTHEAFYTVNLRWLIEKYPEDWKGIIRHYAVEHPDDRWPRRHTVKLTTSLHVYKDLTRHRTMSFAIESTRYCNYSKSKFGSELTFIRPIWSSPSGEFTKTPDPDAIFESYCKTTEKAYLDLIALGWQAQQAAEVLPQCVKADVIITGFEDDWDHIFDLRALGTTGKPHPEVERIIAPIMEEFHGKGWTNRTLQKTDTKVAEGNGSIESNVE